MVWSSYSRAVKSWSSYTSTSTTLTSKYELRSDKKSNLAGNLSFNLLKISSHVDSSVSPNFALDNDSTNRSLYSSASSLKGITVSAPLGIYPQFPSSSCAKDKPSKSLLFLYL